MVRRVRAGFGVRGVVRAGRHRAARRRRGDRRRCGDGLMRAAGARGDGGEGRAGGEAEEEERRRTDKRRPRRRFDFAFGYSSNKTLTYEGKFILSSGSLLMGCVPAKAGFVADPRVLVRRSSGTPRHEDWTFGSFEPPRFLSRLLLLLLLLLFALRHRLGELLRLAFHRLDSLEGYRLRGMILGLDRVSPSWPFSLYTSPALGMTSAMCGLSPSMAREG